VLRRIGRSLTLQRNKPGRSSESPKPSCDLISGLGGLIGSLQAARHRCSPQERSTLHHVQMQAAQVLLDLQSDDGSWDSPNPLTAFLTGSKSRPYFPASKLKESTMFPLKGGKNNAEGKSRGLFDALRRANFSSISNCFLNVESTLDLL